MLTLILLLAGWSAGMAKNPDDPSLPAEYEHYVHYLINRNVDALGAYPYSIRIRYDARPLIAEIHSLFDRIGEGAGNPWQRLRFELENLWAGFSELDAKASPRLWQKAILDRFLVLAAFELLDPADRSRLERMLFISLSSNDRSELIRFFCAIDGRLLDGLESKEHERFHRFTKSENASISEDHGQNKKSLLLAHYGGFCPHPENSLSAFRHAVHSGADGFECDLRLSADQGVFMMHDDWLERVTGKKSKLRSTDGVAVLSLVLRNPHPRAATSIDHPVMLKTVLHELGKKTLIWLELKPDEDIVLAKITGDLIDKFDLEEQIIVSSFSETMLKPLRERFSKLRIAYEFGKPSESDIDPLLEAPDSARLIISADHFESAVPELLKKVQEAGIETSSFTINRFDALRDALEKGITYIQTDRPDRALYLQDRIVSASNERSFRKKTNSEQE